MEEVDELLDFWYKRQQEGLIPFQFKAYKGRTGDIIPANLVETKPAETDNSERPIKRRPGKQIVTKAEDFSDLSGHESEFLMVLSIV